jgi:hypothetical protein
MKNRFQGLLVLGVLSVALGAWFIIMTTQSKPPSAPVPFPVPNGYVDIVAAGRMLAGTSPSTDEQCRQYVAVNPEALRLVRQGLSRECRVPIEYSESYLETHMPELSKMKALAQALKAEGKVAELDGRTADAARSYLNTIRLGHEIRRGGLLIDGLVGVACEAIGLSALRTLSNTTNTMDAKQYQEAIQALEQIDARREPIATIFQQEKAFVRAFGWRSRMAELVTRSSTKKALDKAEQKFLDQVTTLRELLLDLAARAYEKEKGQWPTNLAALTPAYLKSIPCDPRTGIPLTRRFEP